MAEMKPRIIASVSAGAPDGPMTLQDWIEWRRAEDQRMVAALIEQIKAHFEREGGGAVEH